MTFIIVFGIFAYLAVGLVVLLAARESLDIAHSLTAKIVVYPAVVFLWPLVIVLLLLALLSWMTSGSH